MQSKFFLIFLLILLLKIEISFAQKVSAIQQKTDSIQTSRQWDITDFYKRITHSKSNFTLARAATEKPQFAFAPAAGYTLQTGFAALMSANMVFAFKDSKVSTMLGNIAYTQYNQVIFPVHADIWTRHDKYNFVSDNRFMKYPSETFGLSGNPRRYNAEQTGYYIDFSYIKFHESILRKIATNLYGGAGYFYDYLWNEKEVDPPAKTVTSFQRYGIHSNETASGFNFQLLYDSRDNQVNPKKGFYLSANYRKNLRWMGSSTHWQSEVIELKKYFTFPQNSKNVLALWNYNWFTTGMGAEKTPYLLLPSTGWDDFFNTGRGYIQGRFRGRNMSYAEAEYRFRILNNGLLGGVVFANAQTFTRDVVITNHHVFELGYGAGLRILINKLSDTNLCIDYGWGQNGSQGFFVNLGEVF